MPKFEIRRYTIKELCELYNCSRKTMWRWVRSSGLGPRISRFYNTAQIKLLVDRIGKP